MDEEKITIGVRASADLKHQLTSAAARNGRTLSAEAEIRLKQSFRGDEHFLEQLKAMEERGMARALAELNEIIDAGLAGAARRAALCHTAEPCPNCGAVQVQLVSWARPAQWRCRECRHRWEERVSERERE